MEQDILIEIRKHGSVSEKFVDECSTDIVISGHYFEFIGIKFNGQ